MDLSLPMPATDLLPQKPPFQLVDTLLMANADGIRTGFTVPQIHPLLHEGLLSEAGLIENMAQTAAAGSGYQCAQRQVAVPVGYIGAIKNLSIHALPAIGHSIETTVRTLHEVGNASIVAAECRLAEQLIASCELTIFVS